MDTVSVTEGITYGFRIMVYYVAVVIVGQVVAAVGGGMVAAATDTGLGQEPNFGLALFGLLVGLLGAFVVFAGVFGAIYKVIADGVAKGRSMSPSTD
jgi:ABC-type thiamin/hydroxymethylpyrimidine transport system permease subunit